MPITGQEGALKTAGLRKVMFLAYATQEDALEAIIPDEKSTKAWEQWVGVVAPGEVVLKTKGQDMTYKDAFVEDPKRVEMETYGLGMRIAFEDVDDDQYGPYSRFSDALGRAHKVKMAESRANMLINGAFSTALATGYDGLALCSTAHTLQGVDRTWTYSTAPTFPNSKTVSTWSNRLATDSDYDYLSHIDACTLLKRTISPEGNPSMLTPKYLVGATELWATFAEILGSPDRPDTANRSKSAVAGSGITPIVCPLAFDTDAWVLVADRHDMHLFLRQALKSKTRDAFGSWDIIEETIHRHGWGFNDPRGVVGSPGA